MRCVKCGNDVKKKDRDAAGGKCSKCKHPFVTDPSSDGMTDMMVRNAENVVSANGTYFFLEKQLEYQLIRTFRKKARESMTFGLVMLALFVVTLLLSTATGEPALLLFTLASAVAGLIAVAKNSTHSGRANRVPAVIKRWVDVNPHAKLIKDKKYTFSSDNSHLEEVSFDRVLVCDKNETVNFFLENLFHFHYSCPVLGGNGYPEAMYGDMLRRLKSNPNVKVFLLHDCSPQGFEFVHAMRTDPHWFGDREYQIVDMGLNYEQSDKLFKHMTIERAGWASNEVSGTAEVAIFAPATLIMLCGAALNEELPLDQLQQAAATQDNGGGYG